MPSLRRKNPFLLPHRKSVQAELPLRPHSHQFDQDFYVEIDDSAKALAKFEREVVPEGVMDDGCLVVVTGREGSGKSSFVNRCVARFCVSLEERTDSPMVVPVVVDLGQEQPRAESIPARASEVCRRIVRKLEKLLGEDANASSYLARLQSIGKNAVLDSNELDSFYLELSDLLTELDEKKLGRFLLIVMLPACLDAPKPEVDNYSRWVRPRLLFLMESSVYGSEQTGVRIGGVPPLVLTIGDLRSSDGWLFVRTRLACNGDNVSTPPTVTEETMNQLMRDGISMRQLQWLMFGVFSEAISSDEPADEITMTEILHFGFKQALKSRTRNVGGLA